MLILRVPLFKIREMLIKLTQLYRERQIELPVTIKLIVKTRRKNKECVYQIKRQSLIKSHGMTQINHTNVESK